MSLNTTQIDEFFDTGFVVLPELFSLAEVALIKAAFERLQRKAQQFQATTISNGTQFVLEGQKIHRIVWCLGEEPGLRSIANDAKLLDPVATLLGSREMDQLICQAHFKLPGDKVDFSWHQDSEHRRYGTPEWRDINGRGSYVQTLLAVDEITAQNGPVKFIRNSSRRGHLGLNQITDKSQYINVQSIAAPTLKPGSLVLFGPYVIHGSEPNHSRQPRRVFINGFCSPGANSRQYPGCGTGQRVGLRV